MGPTQESKKKSKKDPSTEKGKPRKKKAPRKPGKRYTQSVFQDWCKACGICIAFCPKQVIGKDDTGTPVFLHPEDCIGCRFCELHCPDFAITIEEDSGGKEAAS
jgi:2-oxoglutarate ferredoxin oxidoreductase subunit delta